MYYLLEVVNKQHRIPTLQQYALLQIHQIGGTDSRLSVDGVQPAALQKYHNPGSSSTTPSSLCLLFAPLCTHPLSASIFTSHPLITCCHRSHKAYLLLSTTKMRFFAAVLVASSALVSAFDEAGIIQVTIDTTCCCIIMLSRVCCLFWVILVVFCARMTRLGED